MGVTDVENHRLPPTGEAQPAIDETVPPRETWTELRRATTGDPELRGKQNAAVIGAGDAALEA
jgi:hypothetical protein